MGVCTGRRRLWSTLTLLSAIALMAAAVYLFISVHDLVVSLTCVITLLAKLQEVGTSLGASAVDQLPSGFIDTMRLLVPYLDFAAIVPALISTLFLLAAAALGCGCKKGQRTFFCAKCLVLLSELVLAITLAFYVVVAAAALMADRPVLADQWAQFTAVCSDSLPELQAAINDATAAVAQLRSSGATPGQITTAQGDLDRAIAQKDDFVQMCGCLDQVPDQVLGLRGAGLAGLGTTLLAYVAVNGLCCAAGCCRRPASARVAPGDDDLEYIEGDAGAAKEVDEEYDEDLIAN